MDTSTLHALVLTTVSEPLTPAAVASFVADASNADFYDAFARVLAVEFIENRIPYEQADTAMSHLFVFACIEGEGDLPPFAREIFEAFDLGEYIHAGDPSGTNSERKYTRPRLRRILEREQVE